MLASVASFRMLEHVRWAAASGALGLLTVVTGACDGASASTESPPAAGGAEPDPIAEPSSAEANASPRAYRSQRLDGEVASAEVRNTCDEPIELFVLFPEPDSKGASDLGRPPAGTGESFVIAPGETVTVTLAPGEWIKKFSSPDGDGGMASGDWNGPMALEFGCHTVNERKLPVP